MPFSTKPPQGETVKDAYDRVINIVQKVIDKHKNGQICIVAHEIVISLIKCHFSNQDLNDIWNMTPSIGSWELLDIS